jgi:tripartite-type tricarboxylate transporter receptor subunit TctC
MRLNEALRKLVQTAEFKDMLLKQGVYAAQPTTPAQSAERIGTEVTRWEKLITEAGIKSDE